MKHNKKVTAILLILFFLTQVIGLFIIDAYATTKTEVVEGAQVKTIEYEDLPYDIERPNFKQETSFLPMLIMVLVVTFFIMLIIKFNAEWLWKSWFFLSVLFCIIIAFTAFIPRILAVILAALLAYLKVFRSNVFTQNISELFIYGGLAAVFVPVMSLWSITIFLIIISIYDFIAVYKTKHMIKMAKSHAKLKIFPGLMIPYGKKLAILGGGDMGLPLIFAGVVMKSYGFLAFIIPIFTTLSLFFLLTKGEKNKFYPAMPLLTVGSFIGYFTLLLT